MGHFHLGVIVNNAAVDMGVTSVLVPALSWHGVAGPVAVLLFTIVPPPAAPMDSVSLHPSSTC